MLTDDVRTALAILDGKDRPGRAMPTNAGFFWSPRGHRLVLDSSHVGILQRATSAEVALFGGSSLVFGIGARFKSEVGELSPWTSFAYSWHTLDPGHWPVPPVADMRLISWEERVVEFLALDGTSGKPPVTRLLPLADWFAMALRSRVKASREMRSKPEWIQNQVRQIERMSKDGLDALATTRFLGDLLPTTPIV